MGKRLGIPVMFLVLGAFLMHLFILRAEERNDFSSFSFKGGVTRGSIIGKRRVDVVSGATKVGYSAAVLVEGNVDNHYFETGLEITGMRQELYFDDSADLVGDRELSLMLISFPLTYNFHLGKKTSRCRVFILSLGVFGAFIIPSRVTDSGTPPIMFSTNSLLDR